MNRSMHQRSGAHVNTMLILVSLICWFDSRGLFGPRNRRVLHVGATYTRVYTVYYLSSIILDHDLQNKPQKNTCKCGLSYLTTIPQCWLPFISSNFDFNTGNVDYLYHKLIKYENKIRFINITSLLISSKYFHITSTDAK